MTLRGALPAGLLLVALCAGAPKASAIILHLKDGATISYQPAPGARARVAPGLSSRPFDAALKNLDYNGGPVMQSNTDYAVYWAPPGAPPFPNDYKSGVNQFFEDLAHDSGGHENVDSVASQYNDSAGEFAAYDSRFGGALVDEDPYPASGCSHAPTCLTDEQIRSELVKFVSAHQLPTDLGHEYFLLTPEGVENCSPVAEEGIVHEACSANVSDGEFATYCAYHGNIPVEGGGELLFSSDPFVNGKRCDEANHPNGSSDSALIGGLSHEHVETVTDPEPNSAWVDWGGETGEIGDKCRTRIPSSEYGTALGTAANGAKYNQVINGHFYWYQQEWSNQTHQCVQRFTLSGEEPTATFTSEPVTGTEMKFNAAGSSADAGVKYDWQFNDTGHSPSKSSALETESSSVTHKFPAAEKFLVALTVMRSDGTSIGTARMIAVGDEGPTPAFAVTTASPKAGKAVLFDASSSSDADGAITSYSWNFGDGSAGTGEKPSHTYAATGNYTVTLTITDASGQAASASHAVAVLKGSQTIEFTSAAPGAASVGGPTYHVTATASSGPAVTFSSGAPSVCSVSGSTVSFNGVGTCIIDANQAGDANYEAAPQAQQSFSVAAKAAPPREILSPLSAVFALPASSSLTSVSARVNQKTGAVAFTVSVANAGTLGWLLTFQNGKFGAFSARAARCKPGFVPLRGKCRPARIVFAEGLETVALPGTVSLTAKPSASASRALKNALARKRGLPVAVKLTFQSALGGLPASHTQSLTVKIRTS